MANHSVNATPSAAASVIIFACLGSVLGQSGLFIYLPSLPQMTTEFSVTAATVQNSITSYAIGYGISQLIWGSLSDRFGRKLISLIGFGLFGLASLLLAVVPSFSLLLLLRLLQGIGAGCGTSVSRAALRDVFSDRPLTQAMSYVSICFAGALGFAPFLGGQIAQFFSWRLDFIFLALLSVGTFIFLAIALKETNRSPLSIRTQNFRWRPLAVNHFKILIDPRCFLPAGIAMLATGMIACYDTVSPFDFEKVLGFTRSQFGNLSLGITLAYLLGALIVNRGVVTLGQKFLLRLGISISLGAAAIMLVLGMGGQYNLYSLFLPMFILVIGCGQLIPIGLAMPMQAFPAQAGLASALTGLIQQEGSGLIVFLSTYIPDYSQVPLGAMLLGMGLMVAILIAAAQRVIPN
jgi:multidrug resistance protein